MREFKDLLLLIGIFFGSLLLLFLVQWLTAPAAQERQRDRLYAALEAVAGDASLGERREIRQEGIVSVTPVTSAEGARESIVELEVFGYRGTISYLVRFDGEERVTDVRLLTEQESPQLAALLADSRRVLSLLSGERAVQGRQEQVVIDALEEGVRRARRELENS